ncbi:eIF-2-alpha kinase GCN2 isoform X2 [Scaptodrosophila lebanonensis]|uniref:non-specific serine/threonine protein kinase n=1 Tax=Drosophila lebanonensis TaxID=7225 RepID=A0A6J2T8B2_DROLE|nr:eIF-2-alpha kinase GCN2 isoform X2 [Scaptodrosophila lebanonensis]
MAAKESFRERQTQELEVIKSIFGSDVEDLRPYSTATQWKPTDIRILLTPLRDSSNGQAQAYVCTKLHVTCPSKYPKLAPKITLEESKGMSDQLLEELLQQLQGQSQELRGEVMIYELAQSVQAFLLQHNKPPKGSFYDEMLQAKQKREQELLDMQKQKETLERQTLLNEVERRKEMFKTEAKRRGEPRRSMSESNHRHPSSSESSENSSPYYRGHIYPNRCLDHRNTETLYFHKVGRQVQRGCCLGHSQRGCIAYTGIDINSGQLLYITEWNIKYSQLEQPCGSGGKCHWQNTDPKCAGNHRVDELIASIEKQVAVLAQLQHKNLIQYECVLCIKRKEGLLVYLVQDFLLGTSVFSISSSLGWCMDGARMVARGVLDALVFLHNKGVSHSHLLDSTVFMDNAGTIRCTDFSLVPSLLELIGGAGQSSTRGDLPALGALVEGLMPTNSYEMRDFVDKCNSDRTLSASELLEHPFLRIFVDNATLPQSTQRRGSLETSPAQRNVAAVPFQMPTLTLSQSRLRTEFEVLMYLGKGAFGDVLKVRNILDNREYAIKRIPLSSRNRQLYKKMTREVELLSRLNHENVVRYFNSWIENLNDADAAELDKVMGGEWSQSHESTKPAKSPQLGVAVDETESSSSMWTGYMPNMEDSDSDGIEFVDSNGQVAVYEDDDNDEDDSSRLKATSPRPQMQVMYIQMEFCEKCTLRTAIDDNLYENTDRLWRLFREIAEGLSHIHQQGIIHRDLKPVNIFLDSHDQIKIGDFGLATTSFLALQSHADGPTHTPAQQHITSTEDGTGTGKVGTTLYVAPELTGNASKSVYNQKVDMYTLGIILFEMCQPPFDTSMERAQTIMALRTVSIVIPEHMLQDNKYEKTVKILRWLLSHDPAQRPTAEELLVSDLVPPAQLEAYELQEMLRHALANPQSKAYKNLVARCLQQESDAVLEHTYHLGSSRSMKSWNSPIVMDDIVSLSPVIEFVKAKVINLFRKHGAIEVDSPLLSPLSANNRNASCNAVHLMTHSGCVVLLPCDLRTQFARHVAMNGVNLIRRYCVDRVYREERVFNFHPKQNYECSFDIITPTTGSHLVDAELLSLAFEVTNEIPRLREKNIIIRMNHTNLLRAILIFCNVPKSQYGALFGNILDFIESRISRFQFHSSITLIMERSRTSAQTLMDMLLANFLLTGSRSSVDDSALKSLVRGKGEAASLARGALRDMETVVCLAYSLGVTCPIHIWAGLPISFDRASSGGIVWQMTADLKPNRSGHPSVLAVGERYDSMLHEFEKQAQSYNASLPARGVLSGAGLSFSLDKLVAAVGVEYAKDCRAIDIGICVCGTRPPLKDVTYIMRLLWSAGIRCGIVEAASGGGDEALDLARLGALHVIMVAENGGLRVRSFDRERFQERHLTRAELEPFIQKVLRSDISGSASVDYVSQLSSMNVSGGGRGDNGLSTSSSNVNIKNNYTPSGLSQLPNVQVAFIIHDKMTANYRRRLENQVTQQMSSTLAQFIKKESFVVLVVELPPSVLNAIVGAINPREIGKKETESEINIVIERFPKYRRYISEIHEEVVDYLSEAKTPIVALYSISDSYYRVII